MSASQQGPDAKILRRLGHGRVKNIIIVLSGKGGVGKSSVAAQLALSLSETEIWEPVEASTSSQGATSAAAPETYPRQPKVGILDVDLTGPSIPRMLGLSDSQILQSSDGWVPVYADASQRLAVMSVGFLLKSKNDSVVWRGPKKNAMIKQFLGDVRWGELDYLIIDTPPGTSDEHISLLEYLRPFSPCAVLVTTPQAVSLADNLRSLDFTRKVSLPLLGLIENMSGYVCPHCAECTNVWGRGGGEALAQREGLRFLGRIPIDPGLVRVLDDAKEEAIERLAKGQAPRGEEGPSTSAAVTEADNDREQLAEMVSHPLSSTNGVGASASSTEAIESATPAGTMLSRTLLQRYRDSQTFPIFAKIAQAVLDGVQQHARKIREQGDPGAGRLPEGDAMQ